MALLEMAGFILHRRPPAGLVRALSQKLRYGRDQRFFLFVADGRGGSGLAARTRQEEICLHCQGLRAHYAYQEVQRDQNACPGFRDDRRYSRRAHGMLPVPASADLPLALAARGNCMVIIVLGSHVVGPAGSSLTPRATILSDPSESGRCSFKTSSGGAVIQVSTSSDVARITGIALGWMVPTSAVGSVVRKAKRSLLVSPSLTFRTEVQLV